MTTQEIAARYRVLANDSKWNDIIDELHADDVTCQEPEHAAARGVQVFTRGKEVLKAKGAANREKIEAIHSQSCGEPIVAGNFFSLVLSRDVTFKGMPRMQAIEIGVFQVKEGKIVSESFFY